MDYYTVISSDLDQLSCVAVSQLDALARGELNKDDLFLVSQRLPPNDPALSTKTGYMSKFVRFEDLTAGLQDTINSISTKVDEFPEEYVKKSQYQKDVNLSTDIENPYILSSLFFHEGAPTSCGGYRLSSGLFRVVPLVKFGLVQSETLSADAVSVGFISAGDIGNEFIEYLKTYVPSNLSDGNMLADRNYVLSTVEKYASNYRGGPFHEWPLYDTTAFWEDETGNRSPNLNDYMILGEMGVNSYNTSHLDSPLEVGVWRFVYTATRDDGYDFNAWAPEYRITQDIEECSCTLEPILTSGVKIANFKQSGNVRTPIYAPSAEPNQCDLYPIYDSGTLVAQWTKDGGRTHKDIYVPSQPDPIQNLSIQPFWYDQENQTIINLGFYAGRDYIEISDSYEVSGEGIYALMLSADLDTSSFTSASMVWLSDAQSPAEVSQHNTSAETYFALWKLDERLAPVRDYRGAVISPSYFVV